MCVCVLERQFGQAGLTSSDIGEFICGDDSLSLKEVKKTTTALLYGLACLLRVWRKWNSHPRFIFYTQKHGMFFLLSQICLFLLSL